MFAATNPHCMTRQEQIKFCEICHNRSFDFKQGLICKLTDSKATFEKECPDFDHDSEKEEELFAKKMAFAGDTPDGDAMDYKKNKEKGRVLLFFGVAITLLPLFLESMILIIIPVGLIFSGIALINKGNEQERIWKDRFDS